MGSRDSLMWMPMAPRGETRVGYDLFRKYRNDRGGLLGNVSTHPQDAPKEAEVSALRQLGVSPKEAPGGPVASTVVSLLCLLAGVGLVTPAARTAA
jgi:hypothetical protein